jgi:hypothetical protein
MSGWVKWWDGKITGYRLGYIADAFKPPHREDLGDHDRGEWELWNGGRDPWQMGWSLPLFNQVSGEQALWSTDTVGGKDALGILLAAYADRVDTEPADGATLPVVELGSSTYTHPTRGDIATPVLDIVGWVVPPTTARPSLPVAEPPKAIAAPHARALPSDLDDEIPFS